MLRLPWGWNRGDVGPVEDDPKLLPAPEDLHHPEVEDICSKYLNLRYQLLPYLYSAVRDTHQHGNSFDARALVLASRTTPQLLPSTTPICGVTACWSRLSPEVCHRADYFICRSGPGSTTGPANPHSLAATVTLAPVDLATMPLYVKAGTILPLGPIKQSTLERSSAPLELHIYPGADARFELYEDDGISMDHTRGVSSTIDIRWNEANPGDLAGSCRPVQLCTPSLRAS